MIDYHTRLVRSLVGRLQVIRHHTRSNSSWLGRVFCPRPFLILLFILLGWKSAIPQQPILNIAAIDRARILRAANQYLSEQPITITASSSARSAGGPHDFFSEADYWWPDPKDPNGPYFQRDGMSNPDNFVEHRRALMRLSVQVPALVAARKLTREKRYTAHSASPFRPWIIDVRPREKSNLQYSTTLHAHKTGSK